MFCSLKWLFLFVDLPLSLHPSLTFSTFPSHFPLPYLFPFSLSSLSPFSYLSLSVHYGSRRPTPPGGGHIDGDSEEDGGGGGGLESEEAADNESGEDGSHENNGKMLSIYDTCSNATVQCDSKIDCELGTDENDCGEHSSHAHAH